MGASLEKALRDAKHVGVINLFRNRARGGWQASVARTTDDKRFSIGVDDDPAEALLKALIASNPGAPPPDPDFHPEPVSAAPVPRGIFG